MHSTCMQKLVSATLQMIYQYWFNHLLVSINMVNTIDHGFVLLFEQNSPLGRVVMIVLQSHCVLLASFLYSFEQLSFFIWQNECCFRKTRRGREIEAITAGIDSLVAIEFVPMEALAFLKHLKSCRKLCQKNYQPPSPRVGETRRLFLTGIWNRN